MNILIENIFKKQQQITVPKQNGYQINRLFISEQQIKLPVGETGETSDTFFDLSLKSIYITP